MSETHISKRSLSTKVLVEQESIQTIAPQQITLTCVGSRPDTKVFVFFDEKNVTDAYCTLLDFDSGVEKPADDIKADERGRVKVSLSIPGGMYRPGVSYEIAISDSSVYENIDSSVYGTSKTTFSGIGTVDVFIPTYTKQITIDRSEATTSGQDLIGQAFFTYGMKSGFFITSIGVEFNKKAEDGLPIYCEIRPMEGGVPSNNTPVSNDFIGHIGNPAEDKFIFDPPVYVEADSEYCFVLRSPSNQYEVKAGRIGSKSTETGKLIFANPFAGSIFRKRSAGSKTWTEDKSETLKFTINRAQFEPDEEAILSFRAEVPYIGVTGENFYTTTEENVIIYHNPKRQHGMREGDFFDLATQMRNNNVFAGLSVNGIPFEELDKEDHIVREVIDDYTFDFVVLSAATQTGFMTSTGSLMGVYIENPGRGYGKTDIAKVDTTAGGNNGQVELIIEDGKVLKADVTNVGSGYNAPPAISVVSSNGATPSVAGVGASLHGIITPSFAIKLNKKMSNVIPKINLHNYGSSSYSASMVSVNDDYSRGKRYNIVPNFPYVNLGQNSIIAAEPNRSLAGNARDTLLEVIMKTDNDMVSPVLSTKRTPLLDAYSSRTRGVYYSKRIPLSVVSTCIRLFAVISAVQGSDVQWYIRTSLSSSGVDHDELGWLPDNELICPVKRHQSSFLGEFFEYEYALDGLKPFDVYDLKCVLTTDDPIRAPIVQSYKAIVAQ